MALDRLFSFAVLPILFFYFSSLTLRSVHACAIAMRHASDREIQQRANGVGAVHKTFFRAQEVHEVENLRRQANADRLIGLRDLRGPPRFTRLCTSFGRLCTTCT